EWYHNFPLTSPRFAVALAGTDKCCAGVIDSERDSVTYATLSRPGARTVQFEQNLYFAFRFLQLFPAGCGKLHAFFKKRQRLLQGNLPFFQFLNDFLETLEAFFKLHQSNCSYTLL